MRPTKALTIDIARPFDVVYPFLARPQNFAKWGPMNGEMEHIGGLDYRVEFESRQVVVRFSPANDFGVSDYWVFPEGSNDPGPVRPVRLVPNGAGCVLMFLLVQRDGVSDEQFASEADWVMSDLEVLRSLLEA